MLQNLTKRFARIVLFVINEGSTQISIVVPKTTSITFNHSSESIIITLLERSFFSVNQIFLVAI